MTPIEHQILSAVKTLLEGSQRPVASRISEVVHRSERMVFRYLSKLEQQGYLAAHDAWIRVPTAFGMQAIARGPDEFSKGPGRPKRGLGRPAFVMLLAMAYGTIEQQKNLRRNPHMVYVNMSATRYLIQSYGYIKLEAGAWYVTEAGLKYLDEMRITNHPWWVEGLT